MDAKPSALEYGGERSNDLRVELGIDHRIDDAHNVLRIHRRLVGTVGSHGVKGVGHHDDARQHGDLVAL